MGERPAPEAFESELDWRLTPEARAARSRNRRLFREMVRMEIENRPLGWLRRRALVRFAGRLRLDPFEARLIVRAVEYECGHTPPAAMAEVETPVTMAYLAGADRTAPWSDWKVVLPAATGLVCFILWLIA